MKTSALIQLHIKALKENTAQQHFVKGNSIICTDPDILTLRVTTVLLRPPPQPHQSLGHWNRHTSFTCAIVSAAEMQKWPGWTAEKTKPMADPRGRVAQLDLLRNGLIKGLLK